METIKYLIIKISKINITNLSDNDALNLLVSITSLVIAALSLLRKSGSDHDTRVEVTEEKRTNHFQIHIATAC